MAQEVKRVVVLFGTTAELPWVKVFDASLRSLSGWMCCADAQAVDVEEPLKVIILRNTDQYLPATNE